jgi:hypothetical protein
MVENADDRALEVRIHRKMLTRMGEELILPDATAELLLLWVERLGRILDGVLAAEQQRIDLLGQPSDLFDPREED